VAIQAVAAIVFRSFVEPQAHTTEVLPVSVAEVVCPQAKL
jgi:hypothetical protein